MRNTFTICHDGRNRGLDRTLALPSTRMLFGFHRPAPPNDLALACRSLNQALRIHRRLARREPHIFGPQAAAYFCATMKLERQEPEAHQALRRVYGDQGEPVVSTVWSRRYPEFARPPQMAVPGPGLAPQTSENGKEMVKQR